MFIALLWKAKQLHADVIRSLPFTDEPSGPVSQECKDLLTGMLNKDLASRLTLAQIQVNLLREGEHDVPALTTSCRPVAGASLAVVQAVRHDSACISRRSSCGYECSRGL